MSLAGLPPASRRSQKKTGDSFGSVKSVTAAGNSQTKLSLLLSSDASCSIDCYRLQPEPSFGGL